MRPLHLAARERDVTFLYTALEFARPEDVRFQFRLDGYDTSWQDALQERLASYTNLPPGSYTFRVRARLGGTWGEAATLDVERTPYFWETTGFYALVALLLALVGPSIYGYRVRRLKAREAELEQAVAERTARIREHEGLLKVQAAELRRANELKSRFLANISHEFRTPLTLTFGPLDDILKDRFASLAAAKPHVERARRNGHRLLRLINQLLDLSRLDAGALLLCTERHDLARHLREIAALFESTAGVQQLHFTTRIPGEPLLHVFDADKIEKVVINLLSNAFKFTPTGGKVSLSLSRQGDGTARFVVADTGPGIPEEHLPHLFDRFYQVESASTRKHEGTGIGLALVKELVELHDGTIAVESTVGFGTRFVVSLPGLPVDDEAEPADAQEVVVNGPPATEIAIPVPHTAPFDGASPDAVSEDASVVLVVEDNADMRAYIRAHLEESFTVVEAENGAVGLERAQAWVPDLVLSDVMMPLMDGLEFCAALKEDERTSHIPVVLLTARASVEHRIAGFESGADAYLPKPFHAEELIIRVETLIEERRRLRARFAGTVRPPGALADDPGMKGEAVLPAREMAFIETVLSVIEDRLADPQFGVDQLADALNMSPRQTHRKIRALLDETPAAMMRRMRLDQAAVLLAGEDVSVKEVAYTVGFANESSFRRAFRQQYGMPPSEYATHRHGR